MAVVSVRQRHDVKEIEIAETIITEQQDGFSLSNIPDWNGLLGSTLNDEAHATVIIEKRQTLKPSGTQSIRIGKQDLPLPQHTIASGSSTVDFEILSTLGKGGMGVVHLARQNALAREVAIKQLLPDMASPSAQQNLLREACITGRLEHPNIVPVYSLGIDEAERPLFVMKRIEGTSWHDTLADDSLLPRAYRQSDEMLENHLEIFEQVCLAMHYAHSRGIIHRDLKPENVMLGEYGEVYVVDWGVAVSLVADEHGLLPLASQARQVVGTPMYMAPEQAAASAELLGVHTDIFALGAILHELVTGKPRHHGDSLQAVLLCAYLAQPATYEDHISTALGDMCNKACARDTQDRYGSAEELREAIAHYRNIRRADELLSATHVRQSRLRTLCMQAEKETSPDQMVEAYALVGACRFGLEQALKIKPDDEAIITTRYEVLNTMLSLELLHKNLAAARVLARELDAHLAPELSKKLEALANELDEEHARIASLKKLEHDVDFSVSRKRKGLFALALCLVWGSGSFFLDAFLGEAKTLDQVYFGATMYKVLISSIILGMLLVARKVIRLTQLNRKLLSCVPIILIFGMIVRLMAWRIGVPLSDAIALELIAYAVVAAMIAGLIDLWFILPSVIYTLGVCAILLIFPNYASQIFGVCNLTALAFVSWRWFSGRGSLTQEVA